MKSSQIKYFLLLLTCFSYIVHAELYKGINAEGNVVYSDIPFNNAEKFTPKAISVTDAPTFVEEPADDDTKTETTGDEIVKYKYTHLSIDSPDDEETIRNQPSLTVTLGINPSLNTKAGDTFWLLINGKPEIRNWKRTSIQIDRLDRGSNQLQAQIRNKENQIVLSSENITIHVKNAFIRKDLR